MIDKNEIIEMLTHARSLYCSPTYRSDVPQLITDLEEATKRAEKAEEALAVAERRIETMTQARNTPTVYATESYVNIRQPWRGGTLIEATPRGAVERPEDMSQKGKLRVFVEDDGDVIVAVHEEVKDDDGTPMVGPGVDVQFCCPHSGGGHSPETWKALLALAKAMRRDVQNDGRGKIQ